MTTQELYQQWENRVLAQGRKEGLDEGFGKGLDEGFGQGRKEGLLLIYVSRFGKAPAAIVKAIGSTRDAETLKAWYPLFVTRSPSDIATALGVTPNRHRSVSRCAGTS